MHAALNVCPHCGARITFSVKRSMGKWRDECPACKQVISLRDVDFFVEKFFLLPAIVAASFISQTLTGIVVGVVVLLVGHYGYRYFFARIVIPPALGPIILDPSVDPLKEANQYFAYGRYAQAVQVLEAAIAADPAREELQLRLRAMKHAAQSPAGLTAAQYAVFALLVVAATLTYFELEPWKQIAGAVFCVAAMGYLVVGWARKSGA